MNIENAEQEAQQWQQRLWCREGGRWQRGSGVGGSEFACLTNLNLVALQFALHCKFRSESCILNAARVEILPSRVAA